MKVKVKSTDERSRTVTLSVDGVPCTYFIDRPQPLTAHDIAVLHAAMDTTWMYAIMEEVHPKTSLSSLVDRFLLSLRRRKPATYVFINSAVADFVRREAVPLEVDGQQCYVLTPDMLSTIEKGVLA